MGNLEAGNALQAFKIANGGTVTVGGQPGYVVLTSILFFIFGKNEFWARIWPALFGTGLIFVPLLFRKWLGKIPTLALAFFIAIEPGFTALSRTSTGTMIGLVSLCAAVGLLLNHKTIWAGIFGGIALLGGVAFWPGFFGILISLGISFLLFRKKQDSSLPSGETPLVQIDWKTFALSTGGTLILLGTMFLIRPVTISGLGTSIAEYFVSWGKIGQGASIKVMLIALLSTQFLAVLLAFWEAIAGRKEHAGMNIFLGLWALVSTALTLLNPSRQVVDWVWTLLPLWTLAAIGVEDLRQYFSADEWLLKLFQTIFTFVLFIFSYLNLLSFVVGAANGAMTKNTAVLSILLPLALLAVITFLIGWGWSPNASRQGTLMGLGLILLFVTFGSSWKSAGLGPRPETELWRSDSLPVGRDLMVKSVNNIALWNSGQKEGIDIVLLNEDQPSLQWAFRDILTVKQADVLGDTETPSIVISAANESLNLAKIYQGQEIVWTSAPDFEKMTAKDWVEWSALRKANLVSTNCFLWARTDLLKGS